jgi:hypothetical protein
LAGFISTFSSELSVFTLTGKHLLWSIVIIISFQSQVRTKKLQYSEHDRYMDGTRALTLQNLRFPQLCLWIVQYTRYIVTNVSKDHRAYICSIKQSRRGSSLFVLLHSYILLFISFVFCSQASSFVVLLFCESGQLIH